jgi:aminoglycoside phosphotransferase (APT) family kinase protein
MDKSEITPELVRLLVQEQFPQWAALVIRPVDGDGNDNTTLRLGDDMSVRLPSAEKYSAQVEKEQRWLPTLAAQLPLAIPRPLAKGEPGCGFPRPWSVYEWLPGEPATVERVSSMVDLARDLGRFLTALYRIDPTGGPEPGAHNFSRGGDLKTFDDQAREAISDLGLVIDGPCAIDAWQAALASRWEAAPVWFHGDMSSYNMLVLDGRLTAVIDFGCMGVGDPASDLVISWRFFFGDSRETFRREMALDDGTWVRGRGWMLWEAAIKLANVMRWGTAKSELGNVDLGWRLPAVQVIEDVLDEHRRYS